MFLVSEDGSNSVGSGQVKWWKFILGGVIIVGLGVASIFTGGLAGVVGGMFIGSLTSAAIGFGFGYASGGLAGAADGFFAGSITGAISGRLSSGLSNIGLGLKYGKFIIQGGINAGINFGVSLGESLITNGELTDLDFASAGIGAAIGLVAGVAGAGIDTSTALKSGLRNVFVNAVLGAGLEVGEKFATTSFENAHPANAGQMSNFMIYFLYGNNLSLA